MRIAFCSPSLEPLRGTVGEYTRSLAAACQLCGHDSAVLALCDRHVEQPAEKIEHLCGVVLKALYLPATLPWPQRIARAQSWLARLAPHWISLHVGTAGFEGKERVGTLAAHLAQLTGGGRAVHVMLHGRPTETDTRYPPWRRLVDNLQERAVLSLVLHLRPDAVHVDCDTRLRLFARQGLPVRVLARPGMPPGCSSGQVDTSVMTHAARFLVDLGIQPEAARDATGT